MFIKSLIPEFFYCLLDFQCATTFNLLGIYFSVDLSEITDINFRLQIPKMIALIEQWKRRILTPFGRNTVVKSLLIPKLNHLFISIPTPKEETIVNLNKTSLNFCGNQR